MLRKLWLLLPFFVIPLSRFLLGGDSVYFIKWWLFFLLIGMIWWPLTASLFPRLEHGWLTAKGLGFVLSALISFTLNHFPLFPFSRTWLVVLLMLSALAVWLLQPPHKYSAGKTNRFFHFLRIADQDNAWSLIAVSETVFAGILLLWTFARGVRPELDNLEKFMNIGFLNSLWRTDILPAADMWLSGESINYYYFGHYAYAWAARITSIRPEIAYQLSMATCFALAAVLSAGIGMHLTASVINRLRFRSDAPANYQTSMPRTKILALAGGLCSLTLVTIAGNQHSFLYDPKSPGNRLLQFLIRSGLIDGDAPDSFWFANSTRYIGYNPATVDKTIHEFPYYSYLVADLHAHVINLVFVLVLISLLIYLSEKPQRPANLTATVKDPLYLLFSALLAVFMMGNYWDFIIYFAITSLVLWLHAARNGRKAFRWSTVPIFLFQCLLIGLIFLWADNPVLAVVLYALAFVIGFLAGIKTSDGLVYAGSRVSWLFFLSHLIALPFNYKFDPIAGDLALTIDKTPLYQLAVLWGAHITAGLLLLFWLFYHYRQPRLRRIFPPIPEQKELAARENPGFLRRLISGTFFNQWKTPDLLVSALYLMALILLILPELVYVVDIYSGEFKRANTMFKFTYQSFVLFSLVWAYAIVRPLATLRQARGTTAKIISVVLPAILLCLSVITLWYTPLAGRQWLGTLSRDRYQGLDPLPIMALKDSPQIEGTAPGELAADVDAIIWLNENIQGQPVILEAYGDSYTDFNRISAFTGLPAVMGWQTHEWLWRTSKTIPDAFSQVVAPRQEAVRLLYTTDDQSERLRLLQEYNIEYIIVGQLEREQFSSTADDGRKISLVREDLIREIGEPVFEQGYFRIYKIKAN